ncbi:BMP family ABC transporter substrate-binding protein [Pendulispora rubella]|uniref:BMP family ABC transporter substrate-binding protein n=1 Tax=Pendulispora rubella TaxID=2741070 RepID=A0ABZ2L7G7_9BACT
MLSKRAWILGVAAFLIGCSFIVESDIRGYGIGSTCTTNEDCHAGRCHERVCVASCSVNADCPEPTKCFAGECHVPLKVAALHVGFVTGGEGWTLTHHEGLDYAKKQLPWVTAYEDEGVFPNPTDPEHGPIAQKIDFAVKERGVDVIFLNSFSQRDEMFVRAKRYPHVKFINVLGNRSEGNVLSIGNRLEQAWWIAGRVAAMKTKKNRLGFIASYITPEVVRYASAFLLGARGLNPAIKVEVQWLGFWSDYRQQPLSTYGGRLRLDDGPVYREELLTYRLVEAGADVVAHSADTGRSVRLIERLNTAKKVPWQLYSVSNDNENGCNQLVGDTLGGPPMATCLASCYGHWGPLYVEVLKDIHAQLLDTTKNRHEGMTADETSATGFRLNPSAGIDDTAVRPYLTEIVERGWPHVFDGPEGQSYATTGQRDRDGDGVYDARQVFGEDGERMTPEEYQRMCWFPEGLIEKQTIDDPSSLDVAARVPDAERVRSDTKFLGDVLGPPGAPRGQGLLCSENQ